MGRVGAIVILLLFPVGGMAAPWSNYDLAIGDGYSILKDMDDSICRDGHGVVFSPGDYPGVSSGIEMYSATASYIFLQGRRNASQGQVARKAFFVLVKTDDLVIGPLSPDEFDSHPVVRTAGDLAWIEPKHPHAWRPFALLFLWLLVPSRLCHVVSSPWFCVLITLAFMAAVLWVAFKKQRCSMHGD